MVILQDAINRAATFETLVPIAESLEVKLSFWGSRYLVAKSANSDLNYIGSLPITAILKRSHEIARGRPSPNSVYNYKKFSDSENEACRRLEYSIRKFYAKNEENIVQSNIITKIIYLFRNIILSLSSGINPHRENEWYEGGGSLSASGILYRGGNNDYMQDVWDNNIKKYVEPTEANKELWMALTKYQLRHGMPITLNTYGLRSINIESFNARGPDDNGEIIEYIPLKIRNFVNTSLRISNLTFNILGYIPGINQISGCVRMGLAGTALLLTLVLGSPLAKDGLIVGRWYNEALITAIAQIARGALEAFVPFGPRINLYLDISGSFLNFASEISYSSLYDEKVEYAFDKNGVRFQLPPYFDPNYPAFLFPLRLV